MLEMKWRREDSKYRVLKSREWLKNWRKTHLKRLQGSHAIEDALRAQQHALPCLCMQEHAIAHAFGLASLPRCVQYFPGTLSCSLCEPVNERHCQLFLKKFITSCTELGLTNDLMCWKEDSRNFNLITCGSCNSSYYRSYTHFKLTRAWTYTKTKSIENLSTQLCATGSLGP